MTLARLKKWRNTWWMPGRFLTGKGPILDHLGRAWGLTRRWRGLEPDAMYRARICNAMWDGTQIAPVLNVRTTCAVCAKDLKSFEAGPACRGCGGP